METWISEPIASCPRFSAATAATELLARDDDFTEAIQGNWYDEDVYGELRQENADLRRQYQKLVEDLREKITEVDYAEDKIIRLDHCIESLKKQHRTVTESFEKQIEEYRRTVLQQSDAAEVTNHLLGDKTSCLVRIGKELQALKESHDTSQSKLEKACNEVQRYQKYNTALKDELQKNLEISERQRSMDAAKLENLELENGRVSADLEKLQVSYRRLEFERNELEDVIAKTKPLDDLHAFDKEDSIYDSDQEIVMDSDLLLVTAFPPIQLGESLLSEMQSSMTNPVSTVASVMDACTQTEGSIPPLISSVEDSAQNKTAEIQSSEPKLNSDLTTLNHTIENGSSEFTWPWNRSKMRNVIQKVFGIILFILGILVILKITLSPICGTGTSLGFRSLFGLIHKYPPRI